MPKQPVSVTLDEANLLWIKGRAAGRKKRSLSDTIDEILTEARLGGVGGDTPRSVVGTVDIAVDDPSLEGADAALYTAFDTSFGRPVLVKETPPDATLARPTPAAVRKARRG